MFRDWFVTHTPLVIRWVSSFGWGGCPCADGACVFLPPHFGEELMNAVIGPSTEWARWGLIFQGLHCVRTFYQFSADPLQELVTDPTPVGCLAGLINMGWYDEEDVLRLVRFVLLHGGEVDARRPDGQTPLFAAVHQGALTIVTELVKRGANVNARDQAGHSALFSVGYQHGDLGLDKQCIRLLVHLGLSADALRAYVKSYGQVDFIDLSRAAKRKMYVSRLLPRVLRARTAATLLEMRWSSSTLAVLARETFEVIIDMILHSQTNVVWNP